MVSEMSIIFSESALQKKIIVKDPTPIIDPYDFPADVFDL